MKRLTVFFLLLMCLSLPALAEEFDSPEACLQAVYPHSDAATMVRGGNTAAAAVTHGGKQILCVMEKQDGLWQMTIQNPRALLQDRALPELRLDSDNTLFWSYEGWHRLTFGAFNQGQGWEAVTQTMHYATGEGGSVEHAVYWMDGQLIHTSAIYDENHMPCAGGWTETMHAPFLSDCIRLADFDAGRFPVLEDYEWEGQWPGQAFIGEAAAYFLPEYTFVSGALADGYLQFLMRRQDGRLVFVGCDSVGTLCESSPLPEGTCYGVENFTTSLGLNGLIVSMAWNRTFNRWGVGMIMSETDEIHVGEHCIFPEYDSSSMYLGDHPWGDMRSVDWSSLPRTIGEAERRMERDGWAVVDNPDPADRLHLRTKADRNSKSLGKYYNGTPVEVIRVKGDWVQVRIGASEGWMMKKYLDMTPDGAISMSAMPRCAAPESLEVRAKPQMNSDCCLAEDTGWMYVIGVLEQDWYHVWFPMTGEYGWVRQCDLSEEKG